MVPGYQKKTSCQNLFFLSSILLTLTGNAWSCILQPGHPVVMRAERCYPPETEMCTKSFGLKIWTFDLNRKVDCF